MVRKRPRRRISEDYNSEDSDYSLNESLQEPVQKKYSLRQRKRQVITDSFSEESGDETKNANPKAGKVSDDDYKTETELDTLEAQEEVDSVKRKTDETKPETNSIIQDDKTDDLIDFEDVIRADIVVNKHRIDYESLIEKSEIKFQPKNLDQQKNSDLKTNTKQSQDFHTNFLNFLGGNDKNKDASDATEFPDELLDCSQMLETQLTENVDEDSVGSDDLPLISTKRKLLENTSEHNSTKKSENVADIKLEATSDDLDVILLEPQREIIVLDDD